MAYDCVKVEQSRERAAYATIRRPWHDGGSGSTQDDANVAVFVLHAHGSKRRSGREEVQLAGEIWL